MNWSPERRWKNTKINITMCKLVCFWRETCHKLSQTRNLHWGTKNWMAGVPSPDKWKVISRLDLDKENNEEACIPTEKQTNPILAQNWSWPSYYCLKFKNCMLVITTSAWKERDCSGLWLKLQYLVFMYYFSASPSMLLMWQEAVIKTLAQRLPVTDKTHLLCWCSWFSDICSFFIVFFELGDVRLKAYVGCL